MTLLDVKELVVEVLLRTVGLVVFGDEQETAIVNAEVSALTLSRFAPLTVTT